MLHTVKQKLLHKIEAGFSQHILSDLVDICNTYLSKDEQSDLLFLFVVQQVCFETKTDMERNEPIPTSTHERIEKAIKYPLLAAINALDDSDLANKVSVFNDLVSEYHKVVFNRLQ